VTTTPEHATIGGYRLLARIGEGGMGIVHLARRDGPTGASPRVALKVLRPHVIGDAEARRRLAQEVSSLERVRSTRIAEIIDADPYGPTPFVVTRYVPGLSLNRYVEEEGVLGGRDLLHFATCLAEALDAVPGVGVLHRDVEPSNVLMEGRSPVLIDFGLARAAEDPTLTATGFMLGTPGYLPPEVLYGDPATPAADVYAWAATVAFAATGRPPFGKGHTMAIMDRVRRGEHDLTGVPEPIAALLRRCLAVEPLDRPAVGSVLQQLRGRAPSPRTPAPEPWTRAVTELDDEPSPHDETLTALLTSQVFDPPPPAHTSGERARRLAVRVASGAFLASALAYAPYVVLAVVTVLALLLRTGSVTRQRHLRRRQLRGRARWYDVPTTTFSLPGYLVLAAGGTLLLVSFSGLVGAGVAGLATLTGQPDTRSLLLGAAACVPCLWWGPGSSRVRELLAPLLDRTARDPRPALLLVAACLVLSLGILAAVTTRGASWSPVDWSPFHR
jgi:hypothetical protein